MNPVIPSIRQLIGKQLRGEPLPGEVVDVPESQEASFIGKVGQAGMTGLDAIDTVLDAPQDYLYGAITGKEATEVGDGDDEITGRELLREQGILSKREPDTYANFGAGLLTDLVLDPWNLLPIGPMTKVGRVAAKSGIDGAKAGRIMTKAAQAGAPIAPKIAEKAAKAAANAGQDIRRLTDAQIAGRPFVRPRFANKNVTGEGLLDLLDDSKGGANWAGNMNQFDELGEFARRAENLTPSQMAQPLRRDLGIGIPGFNPIATFDVPGGGMLADLIDSGVSAAKFGAPGRHVRRFTDNSLSTNVTGLDDQVFATGQKILGDEASARGIKESMMETAKLRGSEIGENIFSSEGNRSLGRLIEQPAAFTEKMIDQDSDFFLDNNVKHYLDFWDDKKASLLDKSRQFGVGAEEFVDPNLRQGGYLPRSASNLIGDFGDTAGNDPAKLISSLTSDQLQRSKSMQLPGGRDMIIDLASDKRLVGKNRLAGTDEEAAQIITDEIEKRLSSSVDEAGARASFGSMAQKDKLELARLLGKLPEESLNSQPLFGQHPTEMISKYIAGRERATSVAKEELDLIGKAATQGSTDSVSVTVQEALKSTGLKSSKEYGTVDTLRKSIGAANGIDPDKIFLHEWKVPQEIMDRVNLVRATQKNGPKTQGILKYFNDIWRNSILNWPSRYVRDLEGGFLTNLLLIPARFYPRLLGFYPTAQSLAKGGTPPKNLAKIVSGMAHYTDIAPEEQIAHFLGDLRSTDLLQATKKQDLGLAGAAVEDQLAGYGTMDPVRAAKDSLVGTVPGASGDWGMFSTQSKFAQSGAELGDFTDKWTRIAGYLELMTEGYTPQAAADKLKRAHVDYNSLSEFEQGIRNQYIPFYTFTSRTLQDTGQRLLEEPGKIANMMRVAGAPAQNSDLDETFIPGYARERTVLGADQKDDGSLEVLYNVDSPLFSSLKMIGDASMGRKGEVAGMLTPRWKMLFENLYNVDSFTGGKLAEKRGSLARAFGVGRESPWHVPFQWGDRIAEMSPFTRHTQLTKDLMENKDQRAPLDLFQNTMINVGAGIKQKNINMDELLYDAKRSAEEELGSNLRSFETKYVPKDIVPMLDPRQQRAVTNMKQMDRIRRNRAKRKEADAMPRGMFNPLQD